MDFFGQQDFKQNQLKQVVIDTGTTFPASPINGQLFFKSNDTPKKLWIFIGVSVPGTNTAGWFCLNHAFYAGATE
jgi:hypothetical protein